MEGLYSGLDAEFYDELLEGEIDDLPFWRDLLNSIPGSALEAGCGTGRVMLPLLQEGYRIDGIDSSATMIELLIGKAHGLGVETNVQVQSMEDLARSQNYSLIFIPGCSLQMVAARELVKRALERFHAHLVSGGKLAVSLLFPWEEMQDDPRDWTLRKNVNRSNGTRLNCYQTTIIDTEEQSLTVKNRYELLDKKRNKVGEELRDIRLLWFYPHEFHLLLEETGFELLETYSDFKDTPMDALTSHAVFLAEKSES